MSAAVLFDVPTNRLFLPQVAAPAKSKVKDDSEMKPIHALVAILGSVVLVFGAVAGCLTWLEIMRPDGHNSALDNTIGLMLTTTVTALIGIGVMVVKATLITSKVNHVHDCFEQRIGEVKTTAKEAAKIAAEAKKEIIQVVTTGSVNRTSPVAESKP